MSQLLEKLAGGEKDVQKIFQNAGRKGVDVIKLIWSKRGMANASCVGFFVPVLARQDNQQRNFDRVTNVDQMVEMEYGEVIFYPDNEGIRFGYILDTEKNRNVLVNTLTTGWFTIQNERIRNEIIDVAQEKGLGTEYKKVTHEYVKKTQEVTDLEKQNEKLEKELELSHKKSALLEQKQKKSAEDLALAKLDAKDNSKPVVTDRDVIVENKDAQDVIELAKKNAKGNKPKK
jgi:hypothetical protein